MDHLISRALDLALQAKPLSRPNPAVGCVIATKQGHILGEGHTQQVGGAHAEIMALRNAQEKGNSVVGATAYVTLEPCSHHGRTGPCCEALVRAGISHVVASIEDPNPKVAGRGFTYLQSHGLGLTIGPGKARARELNIGFFSRFIRGRPWVRAKVAMSLDGKTSLANGKSQWITSEEARLDGHLWRAQAGAILTGVGTILTDDPLFTVRSTEPINQPLLYVVDSQLRTPINARIFESSREVTLYTSSNNQEKIDTLKDNGVTVHQVSADRSGSSSGISLDEVLLDLGTKEINELHVEAGSTLNGALHRSKLVDEWLMYYAPLVIGPGAEVARSTPNESLDLIPRGHIHDFRKIGPDLRVIVRMDGHEDF